MTTEQKLREALRWILECAEARNTDKKARTVNLLFSRLTLDMWQERAHEALQQSGKKKDGLQYPEGCTPTDIAVLQKANIDLANESRRYQSILEEVQQLLSMWEGGLDEMDGEEYTKACEEWERVEKLVNDTLPPAPSSPPSKAEVE